jgi:hypothetical protein
MPTPSMMLTGSARRFSPAAAPATLAGAVGSNRWTANQAFRRRQLAVRPRISPPSGLRQHYFNEGTGRPILLPAIPPTLALADFARPLADALVIQVPRGPSLHPAGHPGGRGASAADIPGDER